MPDVPVTDGFKAFIKTLTDLELAALLHEAREVDDLQSANAILAEFKARIENDNKQKEQS